MGKLYNFLLGVVVGFGLYHAAFNFHLIYAEDGVHLVRKHPARLSEIYVDIREFTPADWADRPEIVLALQRAGKGHLLEQATKQAIGEAVQGVADQLFPEPEQ